MAFTERMKLFLMFFFFIYVVGALAIGTFLNISATIAKMEVKLGFRKVFLTVVAKFHMLIHMFMISN